ncbi:MAG: SDR family NAD(P)-dependent oxidoreductase [Novosphingobium sp.]|nr:SDR family NAD(P)-dependent oxidoreductase [Novosphingobium sp.]
MDLNLAGRRALVTGSSSGIGEATVRMLAEEGAIVVVQGRNRERAEKIAEEIGAAGVAIGDVSSDEVADSVCAEATAALGGNIEILMNNAGGSPTGNSSVPPAEISAADFARNYHTNALAAVRLCKLCIPDMVANKFGRIINVSSAVGMQPNNMGADYSGAKAALNNYTVSLAGSLKGVGITVNTLTPGIVMVEGLLRYGSKRYDKPDLTFDELSERFVDEGIFDMPPVGRLGVPQDLAMVACMLASPLSGYITGANYRVDGGQTRGLN